MTKPSLQHNDELFSDLEIELSRNKFRKKGYTIFPNGFNRNSVQKFKEQSEEVMYHNGSGNTIPNDSLHYLSRTLLLIEDKYCHIYCQYQRPGLYLQSTLPS